MRSVIVGAALIAAAALCIAVGLYPADAALELGARVWPVLLFVVAITVVAELAAEAGVFDAVAHVVARGGRGRVAALWLLVAAVATVCTVFLSLDTTAVLLTPVVVVLARRLRLDPLPFALATVWLANTGSLLLPVSNLTNLLAAQRLGSGVVGFLALSWLPAVIAVVVPTALLALLFRRELRGGYRPPERPPVADRPLLVGNLVVVALLLPALVSGVPVWLPAVVAALAQGILFAVRRPRALRPALLPWRLVVLTSGLFLAMGALAAAGLAATLAPLASDGGGLPGMLRLALAGLAGANAVNNLPAYLALEPLAHDAAHHVALLVGVNAGPLVTPWASLATLLWRDRLARLGVDLRWSRFVLLGLVAAPLTVVASTLALAVLA